jgi:multiple sugar transport system substrate-binding protein
MSNKDGLSRRAVLGRGAGLVAAGVIGSEVLGSAVAAEAQVVIKLKTWDAPAEVLRQAEYLPKFHEEHPNIRVEIETFPVEMLSQSFTTSFIAGEPQDLFYFNEGFADWIELGMLKDLSGYVTADVRADFLPGTLEQYAVDGSQYGIPVDARATALIYNKRLFTEAGLDPAKPPQDMDTFLEYAKALTKPEKNQYGFGMVANQASDIQVWIQLGTFIPAWNGQFVNADFTKATINEKEAVAALQFWVDLYTKHKVVPGSAITDSDSEMLSQFSSENTAMVTTGPWIFGYVNNINPDFLKRGDVGVALNPAHDKRGSVLFGTSISMASNTEHPDECWAFIEWFTSTDVMARFSRSLPVRASVWDHPAGQRFTTEQFKPFTEMMATANILPTPYTLPKFAEMRAMLAAGLQEALLERKDVQTAMDEVAAQVDPMLK